MSASMKGTSDDQALRERAFSIHLRHAPKLPNSSLFRHRRLHRMHGIGHGARKMQRNRKIAATT